MAFDLRSALLRKEEIESARLMDFEFRLRARATRKLAEECGLDVDDTVREIAVSGEATLLANIAKRLLRRPEDIEALYLACRQEARAELLAERGDPAASKLA